jgi:hypothetical protein
VNLLQCILSFYHVLHTYQKYELLSDAESIKISGVNIFSILMRGRLNFIELNDPYNK